MAPTPREAKRMPMPRAAVSRGDEAKTREAGCDGYVAKPFSPRNLLAKVQEYLA